jgi:hypothetical protein
MHSMTDEQILIVKAAKSLHKLGAMAARFDAVARSQESCNLATAFEVKHELLAYCNRNGISVVELKERQYKENLDDTA